MVRVEEQQARVEERPAVVVILQHVEKVSLEYVSQSRWLEQQRSPLPHCAEIVEHVAERWAAERHLALQAACRQSLAAGMSAAQAQAFGAERPLRTETNHVLKMLIYGYKLRRIEV